MIELIEMPSQGTPLCPAGHLPRKGGDWQLRRQFLPGKLCNWRKPRRHLISPLAGEMSGRTEGGAQARHLNHSSASSKPAAFSGPFCACICAEVFVSFAFIFGSVRQASIFATSSASVQS